MILALKRILLALFFIFIPTIALTQQPICQHCHETAMEQPVASLNKASSSEERGIGIQDLGELGNYIGNYGVISHYLEYLNDAMHWPAAANEETHYSFGLGLVVGVKRNVITSVIGGFAEKVDWTPKDGSRGHIFSGDVTAPPPDLTPFLAMSDNPETWPEGYYDEAGTWVSTPDERHWPGHFRIDLDPDSPTYGQEVPGEFISDRDIYAVFDDSQNNHPDGPVGIEVEQTALTYGRPYAEDALIFDFIIHNTSGRQLDSVYVGYYAVFRPDYDFEDWINIVDSNPNDDHHNPDFVYIFDKDNIETGAWESNTAPFGMIGLNVLNTPHDMGVTDFHYFNREIAPKTDEQMWPIITSNPTDPNLDLPEAIFHGNSRRVDTTDPDSVKKYYPNGAPINYYIMTGPVTLAQGETVNSSIAVIMGDAGTVPNAPDTTDLMQNMRLVQQMYARDYQGSGPPRTPHVSAAVGDKSVRLVWDAAAEKSVDVLTGARDFEGYKIYRSTDLGKTWSTPITNFFGSVIGYKPIKIFDLIDGIKGQDPAFNQSLGEDVGLQHSYIDSNLINGVEYWYCVTAYDKGNQNPDSLEQSYQSPLGRSTMQSHTVSVVPGVVAQNVKPPSFSPAIDTDGALAPIGGLCQGIVKVDIVQPDDITGDDYEITFTDSALSINGSDTSYTWGFNLDRISASTGDKTRLLDGHEFSDVSGDNLPIIDGFRLTMYNSPSGIEYMGWSKVNGDTCTFDWYTEKRTTNFQEVGEVITGYADYKIVVVDSTEATNVLLTDGVFGHVEHSHISIPIKAYDITNPEEPRDISQYMEVFDLRVQFPTSELLGPLGWDLTPGVAGYNPTPAIWWPDILAVYTDADTGKAHIWIKTQNGPADATPPSIGDEFTIRTYKPFRKEISYRFSTTPTTRAGKESIDLDEIRVVPDPYIVSNVMETSQFGKKLMFNHLPNECKIAIYTVAGDHIRTIEHLDNTGYEYWDMRSYNDQFIAYGLYVYVVSVPDGRKKVGKFLVIK
ncbi:hypothetical protein JW960_17325 [candidate division KSB1 bacterium]|nr:hypothetical protein [candidate division KSB1 bacterium]